MTILQQIYLNHNWILQRKSLANTCHEVGATGIHKSATKFTITSSDSDYHEQISDFSENQKSRAGTLGTAYKLKKGLHGLDLLHAASRECNLTSATSIQNLTLNDHQEIKG
jgi:hypothetical protein